MKQKIACKIILPVNQSTCDVAVRSEAFEEQFNVDDWIEHWGEKDGNLFVSKTFNSIATIKLTFESNVLLLNL